MHVHANQINPNAQLDALYAAEKAAAKRAAERTRKKLSEFASKLSAEMGFAVTPGPDEHSQGRPQQQNHPNNRGTRVEQPNARNANNSISDWA
jgi:hypothetical protein